MDKSFGQILTEEMDKAEIGVNRLAELTGISKSYLSELKNDKKPPPSIPLILTLARALGVDKKRLLKAAGGKDIVLVAGDPDKADFFRRKLEEEYGPDY